MYHEPTHNIAAVYTDLMVLLYICKTMQIIVFSIAQHFIVYLKSYGVYRSKQP